MRFLAVCLAIVGSFVFTSPLLAWQEDPDPKTVNATCTFTDGKEISVRYQQVPSDKKLPNGDIWTPGDTPMALFTQADLIIGTSHIPVGAYSVYVIPDKKEWTFVVNKNVTAGTAYNSSQDVVRAHMDIGKLSEATPFKVSFAHMAPRQCDIRLYYHNLGTFLEIHEQ